MIAVDSSPHVIVSLDTVEKNLSERGRILSIDVAGFALGPVLSALTVGRFGLAAPFVGIVPLAALLSHATESVAARTGDAVGGLLNATLGNLTELVIALTAFLFFWWLGRLIEERWINYQRHGNWLVAILGTVAALAGGYIFLRNPALATMVAAAFTEKSHGRSRRY